MIAEAPQRTMPRMHYGYRPAGWFDPVGGSFTSDHKAGGPRALTFERMSGLVASTFVGMDIHTAYICGKRPGGDVEGMRRWFYNWLATDLEWDAEWTNDADHPALKLTRKSDKRKLEIRRADAWFGEADPYQCKKAMDALRGILRYTFSDVSGVEVLTTPGLTGTALWDGMQYRDWPPLPAAIRELISTNTTQGRVQLFPQKGELPGLHHYDAKFSYAALCSELAGTGVLLHDKVDEYIPFQPGRYRVEFVAPPIWATWPEKWPGSGVVFPYEIGILPVRGKAERWEYPIEGKAWCDTSELRLAYEAGYKVKILERLLFNRRKSGDRPLDAWCDRLVRAQENYRPDDVELAKMVKGAIRAILLHTIGRFASRARKVTRHVPEGSTLAAEGIDPASVIYESHGESGWEVEIWAPLDKWAERFTHPEWSAQIWGRQRARLLRAPTATKGVWAGAMSAPLGSVVAMQTDGIYLSQPVDWPDDGRVGRYRLKGAIRHPVPAPQSWAELYQLRDQAEGEL